MDIQQFALGLKIADPANEDEERLQRLADATAGFPDSGYLRQVRNSRLAGRAFESYYWHLFPPYFHSLGDSFLEHCLLNFAVQQLSLKGLWGKGKYRFVYAGLSPGNFGAALLGAGNFTEASWLGDASALPDARDRVLTMLQDGWQGNLRAFAAIPGDVDTRLDGLAPGTCGLIILEAGLSGCPLSDSLHRIVRALSNGSTAIVELENSGHLPEAPSGSACFSVELPALTGAAPSRFLILRRDGD